jgi:hypothetical protein
MFRYAPPPYPPLQPVETPWAKAGSCLKWLAIFVLPGALITGLLALSSSKWGDRDEMRQRKPLLDWQVKHIKEGKMCCLFEPDPRFLNEVLADPTFAAGVHDLVLSGDLADERLGLLRELPNLRCIVVLRGRDPDALLKRLEGMKSLEELTLEHTFPTERGIASLSTFPKLRSLCLPVISDTFSTLYRVSGHPTLENLVLTRIGCDDRLLSILKSLPKLRSLTIEDAAEDSVSRSFEDKLREAIPKCQSSVTVRR